MWTKVFDRSLDEDLESDLSGDLRRVLRSVASGNREPSNQVDLELSKKEAQELYDAGEGMLGTDEIEFVRILCSRSFCQLRATFSDYLHIADSPIEKGIRREMSGHLSTQDFYSLFQFFFFLLDD